jgi:hypothetical protein
MPALSRQEAALVGIVLREMAPGLPLPPGQEADTPRIIDCEPMPVLSLHTVPVSFARHGGYNYRARVFDFAAIAFDYGGIVVPAAMPATVTQGSDSEYYDVRRCAQFERNCLAAVRATELQRLPADAIQMTPPLPVQSMGFRQPESWPAWLRDDMPALQQHGWRIEIAEDFRFRVIELDAMAGHLRPANNGWLELEIGVTIGDRTVRLDALLTDLFRRDRRWLSGRLDTIPDDEPLLFKIDQTTDQKQYLSFSAARLKLIVRVLFDLFSDRGGESVRISRFDAGRLAALSDAGTWQWHDEHDARRFIERLRQSMSSADVPPPKGLQAQLRPY